MKYSKKKINLKTIILYMYSKDKNVHLPLCVGTIAEIKVVAPNQN